MQPFVCPLAVSRAPTVRLLALRAAVRVGTARDGPTPPHDHVSSRLNLVLSLSLSLVSFSLARTLLTRDHTQPQRHTRTDQHHATTPHKHTPDGPRAQCPTQPRSTITHRAPHRASHRAAHTTHSRSATSAHRHCLPQLLTDQHHTLHVTRSRLIARISSPLLSARLLTLP